MGGLNEIKLRRDAARVLGSMQSFIATTVCSKRAIMASHQSGDLNEILV